MSWNLIIGQKKLSSQIQNIIESTKIANTYCIYGNEGVGQDAIAIEFVKSSLCQNSKGNSCGNCKNCDMISNFSHPNLHLLFSLPTPKNGKTNEVENLPVQPEKIKKEILNQIKFKIANSYHKINIEGANNILIEQVRELQKNFVSLSNFTGDKRFVIIFDADELNDVSGNALLKVLEEPSTNTIFILTTSRIENLLPTIVSRCQLLKCMPISDEEISSALHLKFDIQKDQSQIISKISNGSFTRALELSTSNLDELREKSFKIIETIFNSPLNEVLTFTSALIKESEKNRIQVKTNLLLVYYFIRDLLILKEGDGNLIINSDYKEKLKSFSEKISKDVFESGIEICEKSIELLESYVYLPLVLYSFTIKLKRIFS